MNPEHQPEHCSVEKSRRPQSAILLLPLMMVGGFRCAVGQQPGQLPGQQAGQQSGQQSGEMPVQPPAPLDGRAQAPAIIDHLSSVIRLYRAVREPVQKAGEPNDVVYRDQAITLAGQAAGFAFQSAHAEAALIARTQDLSTPASEQEQRIQTTLATNETRIKDLQAREAVLNRAIAAASPRALAGLQTRKNQIHSALELALAMNEALERIVKISGARGATALTADIDRLQTSVPELAGTAKAAAPPPLNTVESALSAGVTSQTGVLIQLVETRHSLAALEQANARVEQQATNLRAPMLAILRRLIQQGQQLSDQVEGRLLAPPPTTSGAARAGRGAAGAPAASAPDLQSITARFKALSAATVPLSQEIILLEQSRANLANWQSSVDQEYNNILHALVLRILIILIALAIILGAGEAWTRATNRYVRDVRRRRQLLIIRRVGVGFLSFLVILFGFVTQFNSLATFAGFITAGIAVGLQTILLSVAAYFFIIGRYGIKVGDRITIASVTGDVIDVGLVRFYLMELAGTGTSLNPTGRVAVFSNAVLFQAGTPLYKQMPGTGYAWHELIVKLADAADYRLVCPAIMERVHAVYEEYRGAIDQQHQTMRNWMEAAIDPPGIESRLQFSSGSFQLWARFPVQIREAAQTDEKITHELLELMAQDPAIKAAITSTPSIQPSVRG